MHLFFYGPNTFLMKRDLDRLKARYREKSGGDLNLTTLEGETLTYGDFAAQIMAVPLLATSRLIIIRDIFALKDRAVLDKIKGDLGKIPPTTVAVFTHAGEPDKRLGLFKALNKPKTSKYFKNPSSSELLKFIRMEANEAGAKIAPEAISYLAESVGSDLWQLSNEVEKLATYALGTVPVKGTDPSALKCGGRKINKEDVDRLVVKNITSNVFVMINDLTAGRKGKALRELDALLENGEEPLRILGAIVYQFRSIAQVKDGGANSFAPFQIAKIRPLLPRFDWRRISEIYQKLVETDLAIKTGKTDGASGLKDFVLGF